MTALPGNWETAIVEDGVEGGGALPLYEANANERDPGVPNRRFGAWDLLNDPGHPGSAENSHRRHPLIGRADDVRSIIELISGPEVHLATPTGPGGIGKTRLALEVVHLLRPPVGFVELAAVSTLDILPAAIARALGLEPALDKP